MITTFSTEAILTALLLTFLAGISTGLGSLVALIPRASGNKFIAGALGLSAGVMLYVSFLDLIPMALESIAETEPGRTGNIWVTLAFFGGIALIALIDFFIPDAENPHELHQINALAEMERDHAAHPRNRQHMKRMGIMLVLTIGIHNFTEGMATFIASLDSPDVAIPIVIAIAIHNIPEGISVSIPVYEATGSHKKAIWFSVLSGLAEPAGAIIGFLFLLPLWTPVVNSLLLAAVAGVMVYISIDELLPSAERYGHHHIAISGVIAGMAVMAVSLLVL